jgi:predicted nucleic acid-binding protein
LNTLLKKIKKFSNGKILQTTLLDDFWNFFIELNGSIFLYSLDFNKIEVKIRDIHDKQILQTAIATNCDIFITGDKDFKDVEDINFKILTISEFVNLYTSQN